MRRSVVSIVCAVLCAVLPAPAFAQTANGQFAAVTDGRLVTINQEGTGLRTLWTTTGEVTSLAWSPDGNRLAFTHDGRISVFDVFAGRLTPLTSPPAGSRDANPAWAPDGARIAFRRVGLIQQKLTVATDGSDLRTFEILDPLISEIAFTPRLDRIAFTIGPVLCCLDNELEIVVGAAGTPAWSPSATKLAYVDTGSLFGAGLRIAETANAAKNFRVTGLPAGSPRWSPAGDALLYVAGGALHTVEAAEAATPVTVGGLANVTSADWQPCTVATVDCRSYSPPHCTATTGQVTTQADQPVDLPAAPCADPADRPLSFVLVKGPEHGTLAGTRYTPGSGFTGQDSVSYRVSNGTGESEVVRVTVFVVPRPPAAGPPPIAKPAGATQAPFLSARVKPRLERNRSALARLSCDQACTVEVRLTARLKSRKSELKGKLVKRSLAAGRILAIRLRLPTKPKGTAKTVWITGTVRNAAGQSRSVKLPVALMR